MSGYVKACLIVAATIALLTFAVSIPANLLGTSLIRSSIAFCIFTVIPLAARWLFFRFSSEEAESDEESDTGESNEPVAGSQIDVQTPEDPDMLQHIFTQPEQHRDQEDTFEPMSAPQLDAKQLADVIRNRALENRK